MDKKGKLYEDHVMFEDKDIIIPVIQEEVSIENKVVEKGTIIINKQIKTDEETVEVPLTTEHFNVERIARNQFLDSPPDVRYEDDIMIIPVIREVMVKKILLVEEIRISKEILTRMQSEKITLKKEEVIITRKEK